MSPMTDSRISRADRRADAMRVRIGGELRTARLGAALTLHQVCRAAGISRSEGSRIERGAAPWVDLTTLNRYAAVVGLDLWTRCYPGGEPLRDMAHLRLTDAFRTLLGPGLVVRAEVPIGDPRDLRAWDLTLTDRASAECGVELETRLVDAQEQLRRIMRKVTDSGLERVLLVISDTRANRAAIQVASGLFSTMFAIDDPGAYDALARGQVPPRNALLLVRIGGRTAGGLAPREGLTPARSENIARAVPREVVTVGAPDLGDRPVPRHRGSPGAMARDKA